MRRGLGPSRRRMAVRWLSARAVLAMGAEKVEQPSEQQIQNLFNKGFAAFERGTLDMAIELLTRCVELSPGFLRARKFLRAAELQRALKGGRGPLRLGWAELAAVPLHLQAAALYRAGKIRPALRAAEKLLRAAPLSRKYSLLFATIAEAADELPAAIMTLESLIEHFPNDPALLGHLGLAYQKAGEWRRSRDCFNTLLTLHPRDPEALKRLKDSEARLSMEAGGWEENAASTEKDGYRKLIKNKDQAKSLDMQNKAVVTGTDADALIAEQKAKIAADPMNLNFHRGLARLYLQQKRFGEAIAALEEAQRINPSDPELDRNLTAARIQDFEARIAALRAAKDDASANQLEDERNQFVFDDLVSRVERYPNDLRLRHELGQEYFRYASYDDAIQQFQMAQRSPKERNEALYYLSRCFRAKGQRDMAVMQLETALAQLPIMDDLRKQVLFELGELAEESGAADKAFTYYKEIYGSDIGYRDIAAKMERMYKTRQG